MRRDLHLLLPLAVLLLLACGAPADRPRCQAAADCGLGSSCASGVCWPDAVPPRIGSARASCPAPCQRDSLLTVDVSASDDAALAEVTASLDLDPARPVKLTPVAGGGLRATLALGEWPFPAFERPVEVTVRARDAAGNETSTVVSAGNVTRLRWAVDFAPGEVPLPAPAAPAVDPGGTALFGAMDGKLHAIGPDGLAVRPPLPVGTLGLTAAVTVDAGGAWVPSDDGILYRVTWGATATVTPACDTGGAVKGVALLEGGEVVAASGAGFAYALGSGACKNSAGFTGEILLAPTASGPGFFLSEGASIHGLALVNGAPTDQWAPPVVLPAPAQQHLAVDGGGAIIAALGDGTGGALTRIVAPGTATRIATTNAPSASPVILAGGDVVVPETSRTLSRWSPVGDFRWRTAALGGVPQAVLVMSAPGARLVVADGRGGLTCLDDAGAIAWTGQLAPVSVPLRSANLFSPPGSSTSLGYFPAPNGKLYAVILDGHLDATAPWPKPFHDQRNSGNATTAIPTP